MRHHASLSKLRVRYYASDGFDTNYDSTELDRTKWTRVEISQKKEGSSRYRYSVKVDNDEKHFKYNDKAEEFFDVKVYSSIPIKVPTEGTIRNLFINPEGETINFMSFRKPSDRVSGH